MIPSMENAAAQSNKMLKKSACLSTTTGPISSSKFRVRRSYNPEFPTSTPRPSHLSPVAIVPKCPLSVDYGIGLFRQFLNGARLISKS